MRYARASFLLDWNGGSSALVFEPTTPEAQDPYFADWTTDIGAPTGARVRVGVAWKRGFANGIVVLDPSPSTPQTVNLGGKYVLPDGTIGSTVRVGPTEAVVLRAAACRRRRCTGGPEVSPVQGAAVRATRQVGRALLARR
jgi:hypothetical protein